VLADGEDRIPLHSVKLNFHNLWRWWWVAAVKVCLVSIFSVQVFPAIQLGVRYQIKNLNVYHHSHCSLGYAS